MRYPCSRCNQENKSQDKIETSRDKVSQFEDIEIKDFHVPAEMLLGGGELEWTYTQFIPFGDQLR